MFLRVWPVAALLGACLGPVQVRPVPSFSRVKYGFDERYVTVGGVRLCYVDQGRGDDVVVLLHPALSSLTVWKDLIPALAQKHRVIALDLPGFGKSDKPPRFRYHADTFAEVVARFLDKIKVPRATLVGNSNGGGTAISFALRWPERVTRLVLLAPTGVGSLPPMQRRLLRWGFTPNHFGTLAPGLTKALLELAAFPKPGPRTNEFIAEILSFRGAGEEFQRWLRAQRRVLRAAVSYDVRKRLGEIQAPTLVVWGDRDRMLPVAKAKVLAGAVKGARLVVLPGVGHMPSVEVPDALSRVVSEFLSLTPPRIVAAAAPPAPPPAPKPAAKVETPKKDGEDEE